jgi:hypothetical protein
VRTRDAGADDRHDRRPVPAVRPAPLDRLPGTAADDPVLRLAAGWLLGHPTNTAKAYRRDLLASIHRRTGA